MYSLPSTSQTQAPLALLTKNGCPPTARNARTGEFTPPGIYFSASSNNSLEFERISHLAISLCDRNTTPHPECLARHFQARRRLAAFIFVQIDQAHDALHHRLVQPGGDDLSRGLTLHHVSIEDCIQHLVGRKRILVGLIRTQFR